MQSYKKATFISCTTDLFRCAQLLIKVLIKVIIFNFSKKDQSKKRMSVVKEGEDEDVGIQIKASKDDKKDQNADNVDCLSSSSSSSSDVEKGWQPNGDVKKER